MTDFTTQAVVTALSDLLGELFPGKTVYANPKQQGTKTPAFFITFMPSNIKKQVGNRWMREIGVDLVYQTKFDLPDLNDRYLAVAEMLDTALELFPMADGPVRTYNRKWFVELDALHYQFKIMCRVSNPVSTTPMQTIDGITEEVKG